MKKKLFLLLLSILTSTTFFSQATNTNSTEAKLRAVYLYAFPRYIEWQSSEKQTNFKIGLLGANEALQIELKNLAAKKKVGTQNIEVLLFDASSNVKSLPQTHILYVDVSQKKDFKLSDVHKNTLVVSENETDLYNTMISFIVPEDKKLKFALNSFQIKKGGMVMNEEFKSLAFVNIDESRSKYENEQLNVQWSDVVSKINQELNSGAEQIHLSKRELEAVTSKFNEQERDIEKKIHELSEQKSKIDQQSMKLLSQEQKLKLQEDKLNITIAQNELQEQELHWKKEELASQQKRIAKQREVLNELKKNIKLQEDKLIVQLEKINTQQAIIWLILFAVIATIFSLYMVYRNYTKTKKTNELLEIQKTEIQNQKQLIEEKHREITDSINYAERIQRSFLANREFLDEHLGEYFVLFKPKAIVSGDFYWASRLNNGHIVIVTADSTGHGVPGAIMSLLNTSSLEKAVELHQEPAEILNYTRKTIIERLKKDGSNEGGKDGMDCSLISLDLNTSQLVYSGANNPVWILRKGEIIELKPDKMPVGKHDKESISFTQHAFQLEKQDIIYTLTDGMPDQFGGPDGKKFMYKQLKNLLISFQKMPMDRQKAELELALKNWMGDNEQVDDICILGIRV